MSDERFDRVERWQANADQRFDRIEDWHRKADGRFDRLEDWQRKADGRFDRIETGQRDLTADVRRIDGRLEHLHDRVGVLHTDVLARIAATGEARLPTKREMDQGFADLRELIERRLDPLEAAVRHHSTEINELKKRGG